MTRKRYNQKKTQFAKKPASERIAICRSIQKRYPEGHNQIPKIERQIQQYEEEIKGK